MQRLASATCLVLMACGGGSGGTGSETDAPPPPPIDGDLPDAIRPPADASIDAAPITGDPHRYVLDQLVAPQTNSQAQMLGCDIDGDTSVDNQFGAITATLTGQGLSIQPPITRAVDRGESIDLVEVIAASLTSGPASAQLFGGTNASPAPCNGANDTTCRRHFTGTATFDISSGGTDGPLPGEIQQGTLRAGGGTAHVPLPLFGFSETYTLLGARVQLALSPTTIGATSKLCGAIPQTEIEMKLYPRIRDGANAAIARDCNAPMQPDCGCAQGSEGKTYQGLLDNTPRDCTVTLDEVRNNSLINALFAPDTTIGNVPALSIGLGVTGVGAVFTP